MKIKLHFEGPSYNFGQWHRCFEWSPWGKSGRKLKWKFLYERKPVASQTGKFFPQEIRVEMSSIIYFLASEHRFRQWKNDFWMGQWEKTLFKSIKENDYFSCLPAGQPNGNQCLEMKKMKKEIHFDDFKHGKGQVECGLTHGYVRKKTFH